MQLAYGGGDEWNALVYGQAHPNTTSFLQNQINNVSNFVVGAGTEFINRSRAAFDHYNSSAAMQFARNAMKSVRGIFETDSISRITDLNGFTKANTLMQRWIMANPNVRDRYFNQMLDGYSDSYTNVHGMSKGEDHYDYRRVMDGMFVFDDEGNWKSTQYIEPLLEGDRDLLFDEQRDIIESWPAMDHLIALGVDDPTSRSGGKL